MPSILAERELACIGREVGVVKLRDTRLLVEAYPTRIPPKIWDGKRHCDLVISAEAVDKVQEVQYEVNELPPVPALRRPRRSARTM